jgi:uncharacterized protein involved in exopolysaccharide biosynthesis
MGERPPGEEKVNQVEDVELIDIIRVLYKWKTTIILGTLSCMLVAGIVSYFLPKVYRVSTLLEIGVLEQSGGIITKIENPLTLIEKVKGKIYDEKIRERLQINKKVYPNLKIENPKDTELIKISIESSDREQAVAVLHTLSDLILEEHFKLLHKRKEILKRQMEELDTIISELDQAKSSINKKTNPDNALNLLLISNEIQQNRTYYLQLQDRLKAMRDTKVLKKGSEPEKPIRPKKKLNVIFSGAAGMAIFIFAAFIMEYISGVKKSKFNEVNGGRQ